MGSQVFTCHHGTMILPTLKPPVTDIAKGSKVPLGWPSGNGDLIVPLTVKRDVGLALTLRGGRLAAKSSLTGRNLPSLKADAQDVTMKPAPARAY